MAFTWTKDKIELFKNASEYTGFHKQVADVIIPYLEKDWTLHDLGCGLGLVDFFLAPHVNSLTAIDNSELAIGDYSSRLNDSEVCNITLKLEDSNRFIDQIPNNIQAPDAILLSFYGRPDDELGKIISKAKELVVLVTYVEPLSSKHGKPKEGMGRPTTSNMEDYIKTNGYKYELIIQNMDFGQPFKDLNEARSYFNNYSMVEDASEREKQIDINMKSVEHTENSKYPYYLPKLKDVGIIIIQK